MKIYIATKLEQADTHNRVRDAFVAAGHQITYDWTTHGSVKQEGYERISEVAQAEMQGVKNADVVVMLLPGGRGTHVELGMAAAWGKPIVLVASPRTGLFHPDDRTCAFYYVSKALRVYIAGYEDTTEISYIVARATQWFREAI